MSIKEQVDYLNYCVNRLENNDLYVDERIFLHNAISETRKNIKIAIISGFSGQISSISSENIENCSNLH